MVVGTVHRHWPDRERHDRPASCIEDLNLMKFVDSSSPALIMNGVLGEVAQTAVLTVVRPGESREPAGVPEIDDEERDGGVLPNQRIRWLRPIPTEAVTLHFESMKGEYRKQKDDGTLEPPIKWDITGGTSGLPAVSRPAPDV